MPNTNQPILESSPPTPPGQWLAALLGLSMLAAASAQDLPGWTLVWSDEFAQPNGSAPNAANWTRETGGWGWGNNELQHYTDRGTNSRVENGNLVIEARRESYGDKDYTSARLITKGKREFAHGRLEARIKLPRTQGIWPAFWMLGNDFDSVGWPGCGELDIMEHLGSEPRRVHGTIHGPGYSGGNGVGGSLTTGADLADEFHVFAVEWETNRIRWFLDDRHYFTASPASIGEADWVFDHPHFFILNVAVGGNWPGAPDHTTILPQQMLVDYVRVYVPATAPPEHSGTLINGDFETGALAPWVGKNHCCANPDGGNIVDINGLVWDPGRGAPNTQGIRNPAFGARSCKVFGNFSGGPNSPGFYQDVDALPGSAWTATIKARTQAPDHIRDRNHAVVEVSFLDAANSALAKYASQSFNPATPVNTWIDLDVTRQVIPAGGTTNKLVAPPGTRKARFEVTFSQNLYDWGSIYFDEARLDEVVLESTTIAPGVDDGSILLSFPTDPLLNYQVLYKRSLDDPEWTLLTTVAGDGTVRTVADAMDAAQRLYVVETVH